jgi:hypothetical protein
MQFRDYIFRHNPAKITVSDTKAVVTHLCPGGAEIAQELGQQARAVTCSGSFFGAGLGEAMGQLIEFRQKAVGEGMLYLPGLPPFPARLVALAFDAEGDGRIILYTMKFIETFAGAGGGPGAAPPQAQPLGGGLSFGGGA